MTSGRQPDDNYQPMNVVEIWTTFSFPALAEIFEMVCEIWKPPGLVDFFTRGAVRLGH